MDFSILDMSVGPPEGVTLNPETVLAYKGIASFLDKTQTLQGRAEAAKVVGLIPHGAGTYSYVLCVSPEAWVPCSGYSERLTAV